LEVFIKAPRNLFFLEHRRTALLPFLVTIINARARAYLAKRLLKEAVAKVTIVNAQVGSESKTLGKLFCIVRKN